MAMLEKILERIKESCKICRECDPCCTGNILKKCIENDRCNVGPLGTIRQ